MPWLGRHQIVPIQSQKQYSPPKMPCPCWPKFLLGILFAMLQYDSFVHVIACTIRDFVSSRDTVPCYEGVPAGCHQSSFTFKSKRLGMEMNVILGLLLWLFSSLLLTKCTCLRVGAALRNVSLLVQATNENRDTF